MSTTNIKLLDKSKKFLTRFNKIIEQKLAYHVSYILVDNILHNYPNFVIHFHLSYTNKWETFSVYSWNIFFYDFGIKTFVFFFFCGIQIFHVKVGFCILDYFLRFLWKKSFFYVLCYFWKIRKRKKRKINFDYMARI